MKNGRLNMHDKQTIRVLCVGDVIGEPGMQMLRKHIAQLKADYQIDCVVVNGENSSKTGRGITPTVVQSFKELGVQVITSGNHIWDNAQIINYLGQYNDVLRPANYPAGCPGTGMTVVNVAGVDVGVINLQGRVFFKENTDCPFRTVQSLLAFLKTKTPVIIVDFHAEASAEKMGMGHFLDGRVSAVVGTHIHVQTADERILPGGTAFITDLGMVGAYNGMIGFKKEPALNMMLTQMPHRFEVEQQGPFVLNAVAITIDCATGKAQGIERIALVDQA